MDTNDLRVLRDRHEQLEDEIDRSRANPPDAGRALLCRTTSVTTYPTTAGVFYAVLEVEASGTEREGATPSFTPDGSTNAFYALNLGTGIPDSGTYLICRLVGGKWAFRFDPAPPS
jgi:hypothetical protein